VNLWADRIIADEKRPAGAPKQYPTPDEQLAAGRRLLDLPTAAGKTMGECTYEEAGMLGEAYMMVAARIEELAKARDLILAELTETA
jgi:hypothetical protein